MADENPSELNSQEEEQMMKEFDEHLLDLAPYSSTPAEMKKYQAMAKSDIEARGVINMERGFTNFLDPYWNKIANIDFMMARGAKDMSYQDDASEELTKEIIRLHDRIDNANTIDKYVVVGNGVRQVMLAAIRAHAVQTGLKIVYADPPHFFLFKDMVESIGLEFCNDPDRFDPETMINIITSPSNPVGIKGPQNIANVNIWDLCYNWPQYDDVSVFMNDDVQIFGLAKATGHASSRIGWALVKDGMTAWLMREFINVTTGGVSLEAQFRAECEIAAQNQLLDQKKEKGVFTLEGGKAPNDKDVFTFGRKALNDRWNEIHWLNLMLPDHPTGIEIMNCAGMFAWCQLKDPQLDVPGTKMTAAHVMMEKFNIQVMDGSLCHPDGRDMFRLNLGCDDKTFAKFIEVMKAAAPNSAAIRQSAFNTKMCTENPSKPCDGKSDCCKI